MELAKDWGLALGITVVAFAAWSAFTAPTPPLAEGSAPPIHLESSDGRSFTLPDPEGRVTVLNFWATWCGPCVAEIPELSEYADAHPEVRLVGVSVDQGLTEARVLAAAKRYGATYPIFLDKRGAASAYGAAVLPTTVVIDGEGQIRATHVGGLDAAALERLVSR